MKKKYFIKPLTIIIFFLFLSVIPSNTSISETIETKTSDSNISNIQYQLISAQKEIAELYDKNYIYKNKIKTLEKNYKKLKTQENFLKQAIIFKEKNIKKLSDELMSSSDKASKDLLSLKNLLNQKEEEVNDLKQQSNFEYQELFLKQQDLKIALNTANKKIKKLKKYNSTLSNQIKAINTTNSSQVNKLNNIIYKANIQINTLKNKKCYNLEEKIITHLKQNNVKSYISYYSIARALHENKKYKKAITNYNKCIQLNPKFKPAHLYLGIAYAENNDKQNTFKILNNYLKITKDKNEKNIINNYLSFLEKKF